MRYWWVNQNQTHRQEIEGAYLWSPKRKNNGNFNQFYENMREVAPGDIVLSYWDTKIQAIGIACSYSFDAAKPGEFGTAGKRWGNVGHRVTVCFHVIPTPFRPKDHIEGIRSLLPGKYSPLRSNGDGLQSVYLAEVGRPLASLLLRLSGLSDEDVSRLQEEDHVHWTDVDGAAALETFEQTIEDQLVEDDGLDDTERTALVKARRGQGRFKENVKQIESGCRITGIQDLAHLIASHIKPWRRCDTNRERLDGENGLLLAPNVDHLFDNGFLSFSDGGAIILSPLIDVGTVRRLGVSPDQSVGSFSPGQSAYLQYHRENVLKKRGRE